MDISSFFVNKLVQSDLKSLVLKMRWIKLLLGEKPRERFIWDKGRIGRLF